MFLVRHSIIYTQLKLVLNKFGKTVFSINNLSPCDIGGQD